MNKLMQGIERFWKDEEGSEVVEWALVAGLIVAVGAAVFTQMGTATSNLLGGLRDMLQAADPDS